MVKNIKFFVLALFVTVLLGDCKSHPIKFDKSQVANRVSKELNPKSNILLLTYMINKKSSFRVDLLGTTQIYFAEVTDTEAIYTTAKNSFKENVNAKMLPESILSSSATFKSLEEKYKTNENYHNLNKGMLVLSEEDLPLIAKIAQETKADAVILLLQEFEINSISSYDLILNGLVQDNQGQMIFNEQTFIGYNFENVTDDPIEDDAELAGKALSGALSLTFSHKKTKGLQPTILENSKQISDLFFQNFATHFNISKKKK